MTDTTELEMGRDGNIIHKNHREDLENAERERDKLKDIIRRAKTAFFEDGPDGTICVNMLEILKEAKE